MNTERDPDGPCPEPDGNLLVVTSTETEFVYVTAHDLMVREGGECPWCGELHPAVKQPDNFRIPDPVAYR